MKNKRGKGSRLDKRIGRKRWVHIWGLKGTAKIDGSPTMRKEARFEARSTHEVNLRGKSWSLVV